MTKIKLCGLSRPCDIQAANRLRSEYIGFVFAPNSRRYVTPEQAAELRAQLAPGIQAVGVFVNAPPETVAGLLEGGVIDLAQLHGTEDEAYLGRLRELTPRPVIQAFRIRSEADCLAARKSSADYILLDSGAGTGKAFDWSLIRELGRPYFLAGGLGPENAAASVRLLRPYAVDVSSGIETEGKKDPQKMADFVSAVRREGAE
ncbi:MAG: phosphoribosylanthranilate isomerase [Candidatus Onthomonas sp.]